MISLEGHRRPSPPPPWSSAVIASLAALSAFAYVRLYLSPDRSAPLTYALPLLLGIWHKDRTLHWVLAAGLAMVAAVQIFWVLPDEAALAPRPVSYAMMLANIGIVGVVVDRLIVVHSRLRANYFDLERAHHELEASNKELAAREKEITNRNDELQSQSEELELQNEELQQQSEALQQQSEELQQELDRRREEAEDASQRKTRFLAAVSHDVRTPANAISLTAEVIKKAGEDPKWAHEIPELAEALRSNAKLLVELVSDVLDLARFDSGKVEVDPSDFCIQDAIAKEIKQYKALANSAGLSLEGSTDAEPIWLRTDRMKLARVLSNLIGNAIKFTDRGGVEVRCTQSEEGLVEVHVEDSGVGIHPTHLEHIFDEFYQIKNPERDRSKGTGLGLAICKRLVDSIGCSLTVRSRFGEGTTFTIRIPPELAIASPESVGAAPQQYQQQPQRLAHKLAGVRVLLVEDHESTRTAFSRLLAGQGAAVDAAADGREALRMLSHHPPDVVLLDLMLPDMDGREVLRHLAQKRPERLRCVLAVSGDVSDSRRREVESLGADGLVAKPLQIGALVERICVELRDAGGRDEEQPSGSRSKDLAGPSRKSGV